MFIKLIKQIIPSPNLNVSFDRNEINAKLGITFPMIIMILLQYTEQEHLLIL